MFIIIIYLFIYPKLLRTLSIVIRSEPVLF